MAGVAIDPTIYQVRVAFRVRQDVPGLRRVEGQIRRINSGINTITRSFAVLAVSGGIVRATQAVIDFQTEIQNAEVGIGAIISALTRTDISTSIVEARNQVRLLRRDAALSPGELADFTRGFQQILSPVLAAGGDLERARQLNRLGLVAGAAINPERGLINLPFDIAQALTQGVGVRTTRDLNIALRAIGVSNEEFNRLTSPERLETLERAFGTFGDAAEVMGRTWDAQTATLRDNTKEIVRTVSAPIFQRWTEQLIGINQWLEENNSVTTVWAFNLGQNVLSVYDDILNRLPRIAAASTTIVGTLAGLQVGRGIAAAGGAGGVVTGVFAFIGGAIAQAAQRWPEEAARARDALGRLGGDMVRFIRAVGVLVFDNPLTEAFGREMLQSVTEIATATSTLLGALTDLLEGINRLVDTVPDVPDITSPNELLGRTITNAVETATVAAPAVVDRGFPTLFGPEGLFFRGRQDFRPPQSFIDLQRPTVPLEIANISEIIPELDEISEVTPAPITNINGPVTVIIRAERLDNPDLVARSAAEGFRRLREFGESGRSILQPRPN